MSKPTANVDSVKQRGTENLFVDVNRILFCQKDCFREWATTAIRRSPPFAKIPPSVSIMFWLFFCRVYSVAVSCIIS
jgi:hypothetical protein